MSESLNRGHSLSMALRETGFNRIGLTMVEAAERAGTLGETLQIMHAYFQRELAWKSRYSQLVRIPPFSCFSCWALWLLPLFLSFLPLSMYLNPCKFPCPC